MTLHLRNGVLRGISNLSSNTSRTLAKTPCHSRFASIISTKRAAAATILVTRHFSTTQIGRTESSDFEFNSSAVELYSSGKNAVREISEQTLEDSLKDDDYFDLKGLVSMQELFDAGVHYGHKKGMGYETMTEYLLGHRFDSCIIDLNHTAPLLEDALNFTAHIAFRGGKGKTHQRNSGEEEKGEEEEKDDGKKLMFLFQPRRCPCRCVILFRLTTKAFEIVVVSSCY